MADKTFAEALWSTFPQGAWWGEKIPEFLIFSVLVSGAVICWQRLMRRREQEPYEGWFLRVVGYGDKDQKMDREEIRRFMVSDFERWKFVKSVASGVCRLKSRTIQDAKDVWVFWDETRKLITVDFTKLPHSQVTLWEAEKPHAAQDKTVIV